MSKNGLVKIAGAAALTAAFCHGSEAKAQSASLFGDPRAREPLMLDSTWYYVAQEEPRKFHVQDTIRVVVNENSQVTSEGELQRRKRARMTSVLQSWLMLDGLDLKLAPQASGDPEIAGNMNRQYQASGEMESRDSMRFTIKATIVDIRPNGNMVLEAHKTIQMDDEMWQAKLSGIIQPQDVLPNGTVLSDDVAELMVEKHVSGAVTDSYRRGWGTKFIDRLFPF